MNSRYDRMIQTVNVLHTTPTTIVRPPRQRAVSSSSAAAYDSPSTPADAYSAYHGGALGEDFSVLKMDRPRSSVRGHDPFHRSTFGDPDENHSFVDAAGQVPSWLQTTITTLDSKHPLRLLLPQTTDSSSSILDESSETADQQTADSSPFAFVHPSKPELSNVSKRSPREIAPVPLQPPWEYVDQPLVTNQVTRVALVSPQNRPLSSGPFARHGLPFSSAGPAATFPLVVDIAPAFAPPLTPALGTLLQYRDSSAGVMPVPFSTPGPTCLNGGPRASLVYSADYDSASPAWLLPPRPDELPPLLSPQHNRKPFSTPGPMAGIATSVDEDFHQSTEDIAPLLSSAQGLCPSPSHATAHMPWLQGSPLPTSPVASPPPEAAKCSVPSPAKLRQSYLDAPVIRFDAEDATRELPLNYEALGFKWEKFDRGDIVLNASSSSPPPADNGDSEEAFWSQPLRVQSPHTPNRAGLFEHTRPPEADLQSSPASLRLSGVSTPDLQIPSARDHVVQLRTPSPHAHEPQASQQSEDGDDFTWIVTPRDLPAPSTNRPIAKPACEDRDPWADDAGRWERSSGEHGDHCVDELDEEEPSTSAPPGVPFAPAPGIYISPLRGTDDEIAGESGPAPTNGVQAVSTQPVC